MMMVMASGVLKSCHHVCLDSCDCVRNDGDDDDRFCCVIFD